MYPLTTYEFCPFHPYSCPGKFDFSPLRQSSTNLHRYPQIMRRLINRSLHAFSFSSAWAVCDELSRGGCLWPAAARSCWTLHAIFERVGLSGRLHDPHYLEYTELSALSNQYIFFNGSSVLHLEGYIESEGFLDGGGLAFWLMFEGLCDLAAPFPYDIEIADWLHFYRFDIKIACVHIGLCEIPAMHALHECSQYKIIFDRILSQKSQALTILTFKAAEV